MDVDNESNRLKLFEDRLGGRQMVLHMVEMWLGKLRHGRELAGGWCDFALKES